MIRASHRELRVRRESWPIDKPFRISRGVKSEAQVVVVELTVRPGADTAAAKTMIGRGECVPYARYGETPDAVVTTLESVRDPIERGLDRAGLLHLLPPGAARNALDAALWDLEARLANTSVNALLGIAETPPLETAFTVSLDTPEQMAAVAAGRAAMPLLKVKVDAHDPRAQIEAVHRAAPQARLIVDANEGWDFELLKSMQDTLASCGAVLVEQPLPAGEDQCLEYFVPQVPICADESCHTSLDLPQLRQRYQAVNLKLDKTGGLTAALELASAAREAGFLLMVGCMVCTSLAIAPALPLAAAADFVDLDGPFLLRTDRAGGALLQDGRLQPPRRGFWGSPPDAC